MKLTKYGKKITLFRNEFLNDQVDIYEINTKEELNNCLKGLDFCKVITDGKLAYVFNGTKATDFQMLSTLKEYILELNPLKFLVFDLSSKEAFKSTSKCIPNELEIISTLFKEKFNDVLKLHFKR